MKTPLISIVISVYNGGDKLGATLNSLVNQSFQDFELIIIDDGSTDNSSNIIDMYAAKDDRVRVISHANVGLTKSLMIGIRNAKGRYIARQDSGDISHPKRLEKQIDYLCCNPEVKLLGTLYNIVANGSVVDTVHYPTDSDDIRTSIHRYNCFMHGSLMFDKQAYFDIGEYREEYKCSQDYELCIRFTKKYKTANLPDALYDYDVNVGSITFTKLDDQAYYALLARCLHYYEDISSGGIEKIMNSYKYQISLGYMYWIGIVNKFDADAALSIMRKFIDDKYTPIERLFLIIVLNIRGLVSFHKLLNDHYKSKLTLQ